MVNQFIKQQKLELRLILIASTLSLISLGYQTFEYYTTGSCGCSADTNIVFETYSTIWGIPISLIGLFGVSITILFSLIYLIPDDRINFAFLTSSNLPNSLFLIWYLFQVLSLVFIFNFMYIIYFLAQSFCDLCFISQMVGIFNWLVLTNLLLKTKNA